MLENDFLTTDEIIIELVQEGFRVSKRTFQYYVQCGLLPKGIRKGMEKGGVQFYYPASTIKTLKKIFEFKGKGHSLNDIKDLLKKSSIRENIEENIAHVELRNDGFFLLNEVIRLTPGGERLRSCLQCGTCGGSCPSGDDMDHTPRHIFSMLQAGLKKETILKSNTPWFCVSCYYCTVRCPQQIPITEIMYTLKQLALREAIVKITDAYNFSKTFVDLVKKYGRSFDFGLTLRYHLTHNPMSKISWGSLAIKLFQKERLVTGPSKIKDIKGFTKILEKAREIGGIR
jgi:heterodisulfide reductase subunit C